MLHFDLIKNLLLKFFIQYILIIFFPFPTLLTPPRFFPLTYPTNFMFFPSLLKKETGKTKQNKTKGKKN